MLSKFFLLILPLAGFIGTLVGYAIGGFHGVKTAQWFILVVFGFYSIISLGYLYIIKRQAMKKSIHYR